MLLLQSGKINNFDKVFPSYYSVLSMSNGLVLSTFACLRLNLISEANIHYILQSALFKSSTFGLVGLFFSVVNTDYFVYFLLVYMSSIQF